MQRGRQRRRTPFWCQFLRSHRAPMKSGFNTWRSPVLKWVVPGQRPAEALRRQPWNFESLLLSRDHDSVFPSQIGNPFHLRIGWLFTRLLLKSLVKTWLIYTQITQLSLGSASVSRFDTLLTIVTTSRCSTDGEFRTQAETANSIPTRQTTG